MSAGEMDDAESNRRCSLSHARDIQDERLRRVQGRKMDRDDAGDGRIARTEVGNREAEEDADRSRVVFRFEVLVR